MNNFARFGAALAVIVALLLVIGCASSSVATNSSLELPRTVKTEMLTGEVAPYADVLYQPLRSLGFKVGYTDDPRAARLEVGFDPNVWHTEIVLRLWQGGTLLVESKASNTGWGTGIARPDALANLAATVAENFLDEMANIEVAILEDRRVAEEVCSRVYEDPGLDPIRNKLALEGVEHQSFSMLMDQTRPTPGEKAAIVLWADKLKECLESTVNAMADNNVDSARIQIELARFNAMQILLAELAMSEISYGEFSKKRVELESSLSGISQALDAADKERFQEEVQRGMAITRDTQRRYQGIAAATMQQTQQNLWQQQMLNHDMTKTLIQSNTQLYNTYRPTTTNCQWLGNQLQCTTR